MIMSHAASLRETFAEFGMLFFRHVLRSTQLRANESFWGLASRKREQMSNNEGVMAV